MIELLLAAERLLAANRPDDAGRLFGQVAEADPRNAIAVVGLARVAVVRGEHDAAARLARRALEIDPDDPAARRLLESLEWSPEEAPAPEPVPRSWLRRLLDRLRGR